MLKWLCLVALLGSVGCVANCQQALEVTLTNHPDGKPRPAATVSARCGAETWQWICDDVTATSEGVECDNRVVARRRAK